MKNDRRICIYNNELSKKYITGWSDSKGRTAWGWHDKDFYAYKPSWEHEDETSTLVCILSEGNEKMNFLLAVDILDMMDDIEWRKGKMKVKNKEL